MRYWAERRPWTGARLLLLVVVVLPVLQPAQADGYPVFRHIGLLEGLPDASVEALVQDVHGYVWIGTQAGLVRHEGDRLNLLPRDPAHPDALPDNNVMALHAHSDGMVWAALSDQGVVEIAPDLRIRRHLAPSEAGGPLPAANVWSMAEDCSGRLWLGFMRGGVGVYDPDNEEFQLFAQDESSGLDPDGFLTQVKVDRHCRVWVVQTGQLSLFDPASDDQRFEPVLSMEAEASDIFFALHISDRGEVFLNRGSALLALGSVDEAPVDREATELLAASSFITGVGGLPDGRLFLITVAGLLFADPATGETQLTSAQPGMPLSLPGNRLSNAYLLDFEGGLWLSVQGEGLAYLPPDHAAFRRFPNFRPDSDQPGQEPVQAISPARDPDYLWVADLAGQYRLNTRTGEYTSTAELFPDWTSDGRMLLIRAMHEHDDGLLMLQHQALVYLSPNAGGSEEWVSSDDLHHDQFSFLHPDGADGYWLALLSRGLYHLDAGTQARQLYGPDEEGRFFLPEVRPVAMIDGPDGSSLLAGSSTVYQYDSTQGFVALFDVGSGPIRAMVAEQDGLWLATDGDLIRYRTAGNDFEAVQRFDLGALAERSTVLRLVALPDRPEELWVVLSSGVARLDRVSGRFRSYTRSDGLALAEFAGRAVVGLADGRLVIGGSRGVISINPDRLRDTSLEPPVHLRELRAADFRLPLVPGDRSAVALDWHQNSVRFDFSALTYVAPEQLRYRVRLDGWDDDWLMLGRQSSMYYSNLRPGRYRFRVQAVGADGLWGEDGDDLVIQIAPAPWLSPPALAGYGVLLLGAGGVGWRLTRSARRRRRQVREISNKRRLAEGQRQLIQRLNADLDPLPLASCIATEMQRLTAARGVTLGWVHDLMPDDLVTGDDGRPMDRTEWEARLQKADGRTEQAVDLIADDVPIARALLVAPDPGFETDHDQRLALLVDVAGQSLHNAVLIRRVQSLAERAQQANRAKSEFLATMSHEIRTPLHGVLGMAELLHERDRDSGQQDLIRTLRSSGQQLQRIIDDVLDISRIEAGRLSLLQEPFETGSLLEQVVDLHASTAAAKHLELRLFVQRDFPVVAIGDSGRLAQILGNLVHNAVKFTAEGAVELRARLAGDGQLVMTVRDTGPGIPVWQREQLFQPFSQLDSSPTRRHSGSGLGLAICRRLAEGMGASLRLNDCNGPGSCFELRLPAGQPGRWQPTTALLAETRLAALVDAPTYRILLHLSRRWGFELVNGWKTAPAADTVALFDPRLQDVEAALRPWCAVGGKCFHLDIPDQRRGGFRTEDAPAAHPLRWPLVESRLVAALFDQVLTRPSD